MKLSTLAFLVVAAFVTVVPLFDGSPASSAVAPVGSYHSSGVRPSLVPSLALQVPFTVTNNQTSATGYYQQMVRIDSARWSPFLNSNLSNMNFTYASNGTGVSSWIETNDSNTSTDTIVWLDLASIPGPGAVKLFLDIYNEGAFLWSENGQSGIAPELSSSYAKFDNGWRMFPYYQNWSGASAPTGWTWTPGSGSPTITYNHGVQIVSGTGPSTYARNVTASASTTYDAAVVFFGQTVSTGYDVLYVDGSWNSISGSNGEAWRIRTFGTEVAEGAGTATSGPTYVATIGSIGSTIIYGEQNYTHLASKTGTISGTQHPQFYVDGQIGLTLLSNWFRQRATPPNGVMPLVSFPPILNVTLNITNSQATGTGYYQQLLHLPSNRWSSYIAANWSNVNFSYPNGTSINSWIEANASNTATDTLVWVDLANIPARSSQLIYMDVWPETTFVWSEQGPAGIAPELTATYAKWDDGWRVFRDYWNWSGTSPPSGWAQVGGSETVTVNNGVTVASTGNGKAYGYTASTQSAPFAFDVLGKVTVPAAVVSVYLPDASSSTVSWSFEYFGGLTGTPSDELVYGSGNANFNFGWVTSTFYTLSMTVNASSCMSTKCAWFAVNYSRYGSDSHTQPAGLYTGIGQDSGTTTVTDWARIRTPPPSSVMPSLTLPPLAPTALHVTSIGTTSVALAWTNPAGTVTNDSVVYGTSCSSLKSSLSTGGSATSATVTGLLEGTTYCLAVRAWNLTGGSLDSSTLNETTNVSVITALKGVAFSTTFVILSWTIPALLPLTNATVTVGYNCRASFRSLSAGAVNKTTVGNLATGVSFCFGVEPWVGTKNGTFSYVNVSTGITPGPGPGPQPGPAPKPTPVIPIAAVPNALRSTLTQWELLGIIGVGALLVMAAWFYRRDRGGPSFRHGGD